MNCKDCKYNIRTELKDPVKTINTCYRFPPSVTRAISTIALHPVVAEDDFCFEFVAREGY